MRIPRTLWLTTLADLWRLLLLTTLVMVTVLAFVASVKPLSDGKLEAEDAVRFMLLAMLPMLAYALPFSGAFAATLTYYRLANDNELIAARASGISLRTLLVPALVTGLALGVALEGLNEFVIPKFLRNMERLVTVDAARLLAGSISRGQPFERDRTLIYADDVQRVDPEPGTGATDKLILSRLLYVEKDSAGNIVSEATATRAGVWVYPATEDRTTGRASSDVYIRLINPIGSRTKVKPGQSAALMESESSEFSLTVPSLFKDNPKFATFFELRELRTKPERMSKVDVRRRDLALLIGERRLMQTVAADLAQDRTLTLNRPDGETIVLRAAELRETSPREWSILPARAGQPIEADIVRRSSRAGDPGVTTRYSAETGTLTPLPREERSDRRLALKLELKNARAVSGPSTKAAAGADGKPVGVAEFPRYVRGDLTYPSSTVDDLLKLSASELIKASEASDVAAMTKAPAGDLAFVLRDLSRDITSKQNERLGLAAATAIMIVLGAVSAVSMHHKLPLQVYLAAFFPALASVVTVAGGQTLNRSVGWPGLILLWSGVAILAAYTLHLYVKVARR
ncbi:MAG: LptF/LptG family permease [Planctomycetes bacterium]|nr:LptF/LptG family permease [Planctomycetota bacterium]